jgi:hypothetical protein
MKINLRVTYNDESVEEVKGTMRDIVAFEDKFDKSIANLATDSRITDLLWIAWHWLHRQDKTKKDFEEWCEEVDTVEASEESPK